MNAKNEKKAGRGVYPRPGTFTVLRYSVWARIKPRLLQASSQFMFFYAFTVVFKYDMMYDAVLRLSVYCCKQLAADILYTAYRQYMFVFGKIYYFFFIPIRSISQKYSVAIERNGFAAERDGY